MASDRTGRPPLGFVPAVLLSGAGLAAQAVSTATVTQTLLVTSSTTGSRTFPAGPVPGSGISLITPGQSAVWSRINVAPYPTSSLPPGGTGWVVSGLVRVTVAFPGGSATASQSGRLQLHFSSPQVVSGLLYLFPSFTHGPQFQVFNGDLALDVDCDTIPDHAASTLHGQNLQIPVTLDPVGATLCLDLNMSGSWSYFGPGSVQGQVDAAWNIVFLPDTYGLEHRNTGCAPISFYRDRNSGFQVNIWCGPAGVSPPILAGFFLVGLGEQSVALPLPPYCPLFVAGPAPVVPDISWPTEIGLFPPDLPIPPGLRFHCQGFWLNTQGGLVTSGSVRTM